MARPAKSAALHRLQGTRAHESTVDPDDDSRTFIGGRLKMPKDYPPEKQEVWKLIFNPIQKRKTLTRADSVAATIIVEMYMRWQAVVALAVSDPITEISWTDKSGNEHFKQVESPASKLATSLEHNLLAALEKFSATPASREKTRKTKQPALKNVKGVKSETERLNEQLAEAVAREAEEKQQQKEHDQAELDSINLEDL